MFIRSSCVFISTAGVGMVPDGLDFRPDAARLGDAVIIPDSICDHGVAVMSKRENLEFDRDIVSAAQR
ncbi:hydrogenase expression/formation protein HypE [Rhizobium lentis]|uniref:Hydrogenase expression/formation protein HypE n=1 Tax=Rhizobium lentis TaxID=1138194 RepID=A0A7W9CYQ5_9HYPH|nr:hydrogenase expression/formation protein HypE [Rhizobium lentis]MBB5554255.1 hydrogenase expression/formation protein HypE [Rhizobium lentis]MBB5564884.1 hydrogenase expression/formation protein HypE [Rhizobium lentis]MBB5571399.1 hydrogenase expression/formation protein HypE [Rhizobium lentis]